MESQQINATFSTIFFVRVCVCVPLFSLLFACVLVLFLPLLLSQLWKRTLAENGGDKKRYSRPLVLGSPLH